MSPGLAAAEMRNVTPPQVVLILGMSAILATTVIWLVSIDTDVVAIMSGLAPIVLLVAGAFGWAKVNDLKKDVGDVKELSNGRLTAVMDDNKALRADNQVLHEKIANLSILLPSPDQDSK